MWKYHIYLNDSLFSLQPAVLDRLADYENTTKNILRFFVCRINNEEKNHDDGCAIVQTTGSVGRPKFHISSDQLEMLDQYAFTETQLCELLGISRMTLWRRRNEFGLPATSRIYSNIDDEALDVLVKSIKEEFPYDGEILIIGHLRARSVRVQRWRVRDAIHRTDPINVALRWHQQIPRRVYNVKGPHALWHIDSNLKLVFWGFYIHGCIDGYSRQIIYLNCNTDNRASTVLSCFQDAAERRVLPARIRCDYGTENLDVARYMLQHRGLENRAVLTGTSVHNQRIERLWRDCRRCVIQLFQRIFSFLETQGRLDYNNSVQMFALHFVFLPRINKALIDFSKAWNSHPVSGCGNMSPNQMVVAGLLRNFSTLDVDNSSIGTNYNDDIHADEETYGVDQQDVTNHDNQSDEDSLPSATRLTVSPIDLGFSQEIIQESLKVIDPLSNDGDYGMRHYSKCQEVILRAIENL